MMGVGAAARTADAAEPVLAIPLAGPAEVRRLAETFNRMVRRVQEAQQSQRDLVANVSHELKTPLTSIQGFTQAILDGVLQTPEEIHQAAQVIFDESSRMSRLVQDLVALARLESGAADLQRAPLDLTALLQGVAEKFRPQVAQAGLRLRVDLEALPWGMGDADRLAQVFSNLVDNAIKYSPPGAEIVLQARQKDAAVEVRVADSGPGVKPADRERIFQRFYQSDGARPGMGLGLAITRQIVLAHGGAIRVEPGAQGGSVFVVTLPARVETRK
jgi:signal transduction histidine kinase